MAIRIKTPEDEGPLWRSRRYWVGPGKLQYGNVLTRGFLSPHISPHTPTPHIPHNPMLAETPHLDSAAPEEREVAVTLFRLPGIGALGVTDDDRLIEAGIEVECQIAWAAAKIDAEAVNEHEESHMHGQERVLEDLGSNTHLCTQFLHQCCRWHNNVPFCIWQPWKTTFLYSPPSTLACQGGFFVLTQQYQQVFCPSPSGCSQVSYPNLRFQHFPKAEKNSLCGSFSHSAWLATAAERVLLGGIPPRILLSAGAPLMTKTLHAAVCMNFSFSERRVGWVKPTREKRHQRESENRLVLSRMKRKQDSRYTNRVKAEGCCPGFGGKLMLPKKCK